MPGFPLLGELAWGVGGMQEWPWPLQSLHAPRSCPFLHLDLTGRAMSRVSGWPQRGSNTKRSHGHWYKLLHS